MPKPQKIDLSAGLEPSQQPIDLSAGLDVLPPGRSVTPTTGASIGAAKPEGWLDQLHDDLLHGGGRTIVGRALGHIEGNGSNGYQGLESGVSPAAAQYMGSLPLGVVKMAKGAVDAMQGHPLRSIKDTVGGELQAATLPLSMMAGPETEAGMAAIPSKKYASSLFDEVMNGAPKIADSEAPALYRRLGGSLKTIIPTWRDRFAEVFPQTVDSGAAALPVKLTRSMQPLEEAQRLSDAGHGSIGAVDSLYKRINTVNPLDYSEARDRASALSSITGEDKMHATPSLRAQAKRLSRFFNQDIGDTADAAGKGPQYRQAMSEYARASRMADTGNRLLKYGGATGAAYLGARELPRLLGTIFGK